MSWGETDRGAASLSASLLDNHDDTPASNTSTSPHRSRLLNTHGERRGINVRNGSAHSSNRNAKVTASSMAADEIAYGSGQGLKVLYAPETNEDFERQIMEEREEEVEDTVARVAEAQVVFSQLNALVGEQQEQVDNIDAQVGAAADGTAQGLKQLRAATTHAKRLNACWIYTCGFGLLSAVVLFLFLLWPSLTGTDDG